MVKSRKQMHKKRKGRSAKRVMRGGDFSEEQKIELQNKELHELRDNKIKIE